METGMSPPLDVAVVELDRLRDRITRARAARRETPLGRYQAGRERARLELEARDAARLALVLLRVTTGRDGEARAMLAGFTAGEVDAVRVYAGRLTQLAADVQAGVSS